MSELGSYCSTCERFVIHKKEEIKKCNEKEALGKNASDNQVKERETEGYEGGRGGGLKIINPLNERSDMFK